MSPMLLSKGEMEWEAKQGAPNFVRLLSEFGRHKRLVYLVLGPSHIWERSERKKKRPRSGLFFREWIKKAMPHFYQEFP